MDNGRESRILLCDVFFKEFTQAGSNFYLEVVWFEARSQDFHPNLPPRWQELEYFDCYELPPRYIGRKLDWKCRVARIESAHPDVACTCPCVCAWWKYTHELLSGFPRNVWVRSSSSKPICLKEVCTVEWYVKWHHWKARHKIQTLRTFTSWTVFFFQEI